MRKDATGNVRLGTRVLVQQRVGDFFVRPGEGKDALVPDRTAIKGGRTPPGRQSRSRALSRCISHIGYNLRTL